MYVISGNEACMSNAVDPATPPTVIPISGEYWGSAGLSIWNEKAYIVPLLSCCPRHTLSVRLFSSSLYSPAPVCTPKQNSWSAPFPLATSPSTRVLHPTTAPWSPLMVTLTLSSDLRSTWGIRLTVRMFLSATSTVDCDTSAKRNLQLTSKGSVPLTTPNKTPFSFAIFSSSICSPPKPVAPILTSGDGWLFWGFFPSKANL
mmetsp:Transcript_6251/g.15150  ORF Transcript_6251/g.15150 Transcript_6251/m.15150 type:complete len:202 (-) Transcript_6251:1198-1803(-)